jgi:hypothetical protein
MHLGSVGGDYAVVSPEPAGEVMLDGSQDVVIAVDGEQYRLRHASYPVPEVFGTPLRRGGCTNVSSA